MQTRASADQIRRLYIAPFALFLNCSMPFFLFSKLQFGTVAFTITPALLDRFRDLSSLMPIIL